MHASNAGQRLLFFLMLGLLGVLVACQPVSRGGGGGSSDEDDDQTADDDDVVDDDDASSGDFLGYWDESYDFDASYESEGYNDCTLNLELEDNAGSPPSCSACMYTWSVDVILLTHDCEWWDGQLANETNYYGAGDGAFLVYNADVGQYEEVTTGSLGSDSFSGDSGWLQTDGYQIRFEIDATW